jgi:hypothetical protein
MVLVLCATGVTTGHTLYAQQKTAKKPSLSLKATPTLGFAPMRVRAVAEIRDGSDDYEDFYCAGAEWDWGDGTMSENSSDCDPYEAGKSTIQRHFAGDHTYNQAGQFKVTFKLKQKTKQVGAVSTNVEVRGGAGFGG